METIYQLTGKEAKVETKTKVDCGHAVVTQYFLEGALVRQDVEIQVDEETVGLLRGAAGLIGV